MNLRLSVVLALALFLGAIALPLASPEGRSGQGQWDGYLKDTMTHFTLPVDSLDSTPSSVQLAGEWDWDNHTNMTHHAENDTWTVTLDLEGGLYCYKFIIDDEWIFDPINNYRGYCGDVENSVIRVSDQLESEYIVTWNDGLPIRVDVYRPPSVGPENIAAMPEGVAEWNNSGWDVDASSLAEGRHTLRFQLDDWNRDLVIPIWIGAQADFTWQDATIEMIMTDRFVNGNISNDPAPLAAASQGADWLGGDLAGITQIIEQGYFSDLGINALWLSPLNTAANGTGIAGDGVHEVSAYHGYWPIEPRQVDPRLGTEAELHEMIAAAHDAGIRIMMDLVVNHVHEDHPYFDEHPDWFNSGCLCGSDNCDWTERRLDCQFATYMPDIDWKNRNASEQMIEDALWWIDTFEFDGARIDAVKHVDDLAITNLAIRINERFEHGDFDFYLKGETAMGWSGDDLADNAEQYDTINRYIGEDGLDGQADFVLYHAVANNVFIDEVKDYQHLDYWTARSQDQYVGGAIMVPFVGSHDVSRFITRADDGTADENNQWVEQGLPGQPGNSAPYDAAVQAYTWLLTTPGASLIYQGDEYGEFGGADPDNRHMWRNSSQWNGRESALFEHISSLAKLRIDSEPLRRGEYISLYNSTEAISWAMNSADDSAIIAMNRADSPHDFTLETSTIAGDWSGQIQARIGAVVMTDGAFTLAANSVAVFTSRQQSIEIPQITTPCSPLNSSIVQTPSTFAPLDQELPKAISVFGVWLLAADDVSNESFRHAAAVMAGYLDSDSDGIADDALVVQTMVAANSAMVIMHHPDDADALFESLPNSFHDKLDQGEIQLQDLYEIEIHPDGRGANNFDATLEEVLHLITHVGYAGAYPSLFAEQSDSNLTRAMDLARGGHFQESSPDDCEEEDSVCAIPQGGYPAEAWYHYDDGTCDYSCMATEYLYWALTTAIGLQADSQRCAAIDHEWEPCTTEELISTDEAIITLILESTLPKAVPNGEYCIVDDGGDEPLPGENSTGDDNGSIGNATNSTGDDNSTDNNSTNGSNVTDDTTDGSDQGGDLPAKTVEASDEQDVIMVRNLFIAVIGLALVGLLFVSWRSKDSFE
jgi:glycosidase